LRHRVVRQDSLAECEISQADAHPDRVAVRHPPGEKGVTSTARLLLDDEVLCIGEATTLALAPDRLTGFDFGERRG
jgi:hypothetical protein